MIPTFDKRDWLIIYNALKIAKIFYHSDLAVDIDNENKEIAIQKINEIMKKILQEHPKIGDFK